MREFLFALLVMNVSSHATIEEGYKIKTRKGKVYMAKKALMKQKTEQTDDYSSDYSLG